jgi:hypothetical protein
MPRALEWTALPDNLAGRLLLGALDLTDASAPHPLEAEGWMAALPWHEHVRLLRIDCKRFGKLGPVFALWDQEAMPVALDGSSAPVHMANARHSPRITSDTALDYLHFFCFAVRGAEGPFRLLLSAPPASNLAAATAPGVPTLLAERDGTGRFLVTSGVEYNGTLFAAKFAIGSDGTVEMIEDHPLREEPAALDLEMLPGFPDAASLRQMLTQQAQAQSAARAALPAVSALHALVELLLERALRAKATHRLIENFNASCAGLRPMQQFASLLMQGFAVVAIETNIAFVEEVIADIARLNCPSKERLAAVYGSNGEPVTCAVPAGPALVVLPLYVYRTVADPDRLAHDLGTREVAAIISCERVQDLPEPLRRVIDVTLRLPAIDRDILATWFTRVMGAPVPPGWDKDADEWAPHVLHTDFEHPRRLKLAPDKAFDYLRSEVLERMRAVDVSGGKPLSSLHGLGEAREFAEDLIADIHAAIKGKLDWSRVDRGALLVGPPGTGKTTLARAIAVACGVRFIQASATTWTSSGEHLGHHLRAIRASFAEARRYAPAILFIDEIDSLGNREQFSGDNAGYHTAVVNGVLEQMQGVDASAPVFVIAATNSLARVDAALRRAGRLDRIINIPLPTSDALGHIYEYYLKSLGGDVTVDPAVSCATLGGMSLGLTGADVEKIVRGAARRALKARRAVSQVDLIAEITNKPRSEQGLLRLSPAEIERTAYHEAGHALAQHLSAAGGAALGFVTVVPRSDGSLGFVATLPDARYALTRSDYLERIEMFLGGRAAEQLRFGETGISGGSSSDLVVATQLASIMVLRLGFGGERRLSVTPDASEQQREQIETLLRDAYNSVLRKLTREEARLKRLAEALIARQELTGDEVRSILAGTA